VRLTAVAAVSLLLVSATALGDSYQDRRLRTGVRLFRALLAADEGIADKVGGDGRLRIVFFSTDRTEAQELAATVFGATGSDESATIKKLPVRVEFADDLAVLEDRSEPPAGVFLVDSLDDQALQELIRFAIEKHVVLFSPHEGDVEKGVLGGLVVEAQVLPLVNLATARESQISIKQFFLKVARVRE